MKLLLPVWLVLAGLTMGQQYRWWSDASCTAREGYNSMVLEAHQMACDALESLKTLTHPIPVDAYPDWDFERVFQILFNTRINDPTLYDTTQDHRNVFRQSTFRTVSQRVEEILSTICYGYKELEPGRDRREADMLIYCDQNAGNTGSNGWYHDMENGIKGRAHCDEDMEDATQAHIWSNVLVGAEWDQWNPHRARVTLCNEILEPIRLFKEAANDVRDLQHFDIGGQTSRYENLRIGHWAEFITTGVFLHEWTHAHPFYLDDRNTIDPATNTEIPFTEYGWTDCVQKPAGEAVLNADNYLMLMTAAWLARQKRFVIQHSRILGGYTLPRLDDVSTDEARRTADIKEGRLRFYVDITTPGNPGAH